MTPEQIQQWACEAGFLNRIEVTFAPELQAFATLVRNATLEEAAKLCDEMQPVPASEPRHCAEDIRSLKS